MYLQKSILLITKKDEKICSQLEEICCDKNLTLSKLYNISDCISAINQFRFGLLIIDTKYSPISDEMLLLFKRKDFYVPSVMLISDTDSNINDENVDVVKRDEIDKISGLITKRLNKNSSKFPSHQIPFIKTTVEKQLDLLGFSRRYKGFDYLSDIVIRILNNSSTHLSFKKYIYPYISCLYNVSEESVERDIRNLISKLEPNDFFNFKPTTKNIVNAVVNHIKDYLNKLSNYKLTY